MFGQFSVFVGKKKIGIEKHQYVLQISCFVIVGHTNFTFQYLSLTGKHQCPVIIAKG